MSRTATPPSGSAGATTMAETVLRATNLLFAAMFALSVAVQWNDPDPVPWMLLYGAAFGVCVARELGRVRREVGWALAAVALLWAGWIAFHTHLDVPLLEALGQWDMHSGGSEEAREIGGLLIVAFWSPIAASNPRRRATSPEPPPSHGSRLNR